MRALLRALQGVETTLSLGSEVTWRELEGVALGAEAGYSGLALGAVVAMSGSLFKAVETW